MLGSTVLRAARGIHRRMYDTQIVLTNGATVRVRLPYKVGPAHAQSREHMLVLRSV